MNSITKKCSKCKREKDSRLFSVSPYENICRCCVAEHNIILPKPRVCDGHRERYIYLIKGANLTKIGITDNIKTRIKSFRTASPVPLSVLYCFRSMDALVSEKWLHNKYSNKRHHGEWFSLTEKDIDEIKLEFPN